MLPGIYSAFQHWAQQTVWIYSDPHFSDEDLECGIRNRPSDEVQIANINSCVGRKDTLIILGDVGNIECVRRLRAGRKVLIMGNHDVGRTKYERQIITRKFDCDAHSKEEVYAIMTKEYPSWKITLRQGYDPTVAPFEFWCAEADNGLFDEVYEGALIVGEKLIFSHEPVDIPWLYNIHGHDHVGHKRKNHLNVCSDVIGYKPVNLNQFLKGGPAANINSIHRQTIDKAIVRKQNRGGKKIGGK